jgi:lactoylglutathione lyase
MARSIAFYRDVVGLPLKFETPGWSEFSTAGATWALHRSQGTESASDAGPSETAGRCRSGFQVDDIDEFHKRMTDHGVTCAQDPTKVFGVRVAQYVDPDGMVFSVGEATGA